ncbi:uncharacterized membrane protein [Vibrio variabilis]|uniref:Uncharacterized membrane protein n=1 Tax=Vibrio variabilis TaxID=990271 RepID=A0ABQ0JKE1_9VIBR|nr:uncharacterized membrane protein [Vibrio variabilis]
MSKKLILGLVLVAVVIYLGINFGQHLTLENAKAQQVALSEYINENFVAAALTYFFAYIAITAFSVPALPWLPYLAQHCLAFGLVYCLFHLRVP